MNRFPSNFVNELGLFRNNGVQIERVIGVFSLRALSMASQIPSKESDSAAKEGREMIHQLRMTALSRLVDNNLRLFPWICVVVHLVVVDFAGRQLQIMAAHGC